ncbi:MAG: hypothetical protein AB9879_01230 [Methanothrix sp.]
MKPSFEEYAMWLENEHHISLDQTIENNYKSASLLVREQLMESAFWTIISRDIKIMDEEYLLKTKGYNLFKEMMPPKIFIKPFDSFLLKTYRKNILNNDNFPNPPPDGWILPNNWFSRVNDIIRTSFVVKYLDGVEFLEDKIKSYCAECDLASGSDWEAREEGYYAVHINIRNNYEIPGIKWDTEVVDVSFEIQITTQLQDVIKNLMHKYYEKNRETIKSENIKWQWNYKSDEFATNYLGHILHYVEGMIMEIREKK